MKVGLTVVRMQPIHKGHVRLINHMLMDCDIAIIGLGSAQESRTERNPFTPVERMEMIHRVFGQSSKIKIIPITDVAATTHKEWTDHVFNIIAQNNLPIPTEYYGGSAFDVEWYKDTHMNLRVIDRECIITTQATDVRMDIAAGGSMWKTLVPEIVVPMIEFYYPPELKNFKQIAIRLQREAAVTHK